MPVSSDFRPTVFKSKVLQIPVSKKLENGQKAITAVSMPLIFQREKLMNSFNNYIEQIVDYSLELIKDEEELFELKKEAISFLD